MDDLDMIVALAKQEIEGHPDRYRPGLQRAYARTILWLSENWEPKKERGPSPKTITLTPADSGNEDTA